MTANADMFTVMNWMGHGDIQTTINIYAHLREGDLDRNKDIIARLFALNRDTEEKLPDIIEWPPAAYRPGS